MEVIQRFPKWLTEEEFELYHDPSIRQKFRVHIFGIAHGKRIAGAGAGDTIGQAAKIALERREEARRCAI